MRVRINAFEYLAIFLCNISNLTNFFNIFIQILFDFSEGLEEPIGENDMEICDPCYCYGKCCLDVVASIFCVSLL